MTGRTVVVPPLRDRERDVLQALVDLPVTHPTLEWARVMHVGGRDASHHSATLRALARGGLVERKKSCRISGHDEWCPCKGSCLYKITATGRRALKEHAR